MIMRIKLWLIILLVSCSAIAIGAQSAIAEYTGKPPKYIFLFVGDGMGLPQTMSLGFYRGTINNNFVGTLKVPTPENPPLADDASFVHFPVIGVTATYDASKFITDSASGITAIATGHKTLDGYLGLDAFGQKVDSIATLLQRQNYKIGIVTSVSLNHATPAGFYAHQASRNNYYEIALDLIDSNFEYFGGGGIMAARGKDGQQPSIIELAKDKGYNIVEQKDAILALTSADGKTIAISPALDNEYDQAMKFAIDSHEDELTLADFTRKGIDVLQDNPAGFFMMIEGGKIDWASHANDAMTMILDVQAFEQAVNVAVEFYQQYPDDTLIIVTADHETGGATLGNAQTDYDTFFALLNEQTISYQMYEALVASYRENKTTFEEALQDIERYFGLTMANSTKAEIAPALVLSDRNIAQLRLAYKESMKPSEVRDLKAREYIVDYSYYAHEPLQVVTTRLFNKLVGIAWTTTAHTGLPVPVYVKGVGQELFHGYYENTGIFYRLQRLTQLP